MDKNGRRYAAADAAGKKTGGNFDVTDVLLFYFDLLNAAFASAEIAVISISDARLKNLADGGNKSGSAFGADGTAGKVSRNDPGGDHDGWILTGSDGSRSVF